MTSYYQKTMESGGGRLSEMLTIVSLFFATGMANAASGSASSPRTTVKSPQELQLAVAAAKPGTTIAVAPGTYRGGLSFERLRGTKDAPIRLVAADASKPPVLEGGGSVMHLSRAAHVVLENLVITKGRGNGLNIDDGSAGGEPASGIVLKGLVVRDNGGDGNHDGIKLSGLADFRIENCTVERWGKKGSGIDMVGCHNGVIEGCVFREGDPMGANAVQMKGGSRDIVVRRCRFEHAGGRAINLGGSTGLPYFRPRPQGYEAKDLIVEDCTFIGSMAPIAFVGVDGAIVRHNTFYRPTKWVLRILQENQAADFVACRNGQFVNNIVAFRSDEMSPTVNIGGKTSPETFRFADNVWYCLDRPDATQRLVRLPVEENNGKYGVDPTFVDAEKGDLRLRETSGAGVRELDTTKEN